MNFVFDLDGTLCFGGQPIAEPIVEELLELKSRNHHVYFASARPIRDMEPVLGPRLPDFPLVDDEWDYCYIPKGSDEIGSKVDQGNQARNIGLEDIQNPIKAVLINLKDPQRAAAELRALDLSVNVYEHEGILDIFVYGLDPVPRRPPGQDRRKHLNWCTYENSVPPCPHSPLCGPGPGPGLGDRSPVVPDRTPGSDVPV